MNLVPSRDLRVRSAHVWKTLRERKEIVITSNGTPVAIMSAVDAGTFEDTLRAIRRARALDALARIHRAAAASGRSTMSDAEIEAEIKAVRKSRR